ncbi:IclR family transcriptional regulator [Bacillaceae bacterium]
MAKQQETLSSVHNAMRILKQFSNEKPELGISELSMRLGLAKSTVFRLIRTLTEAGLVEQDKYSHKYRLGLTAFELGFLVYHKLEIRAVALPLLEKLMKSVRQVVRLGVYDKGGVIYLCKRAPENEVTISKIGNRVPAYCTAVGKVLLAHQSEEEIERVLGEKLKAYTSRTITDPETLRAQLKEIKQTGYAITNEELRKGICSVAVPVYNDLDEVIAAISITGSKSHFYPLQIQNYIQEMRMYSRLITERLGVNKF